MHLLPFYNKKIIWNEKVQYLLKKNQFNPHEYGKVSVYKRHVGTSGKMYVISSKYTHEEALNLIAPLTKHFKKSAILNNNNGLHSVVIEKDKNNNLMTTYSKSTITPQETAFLQKVKYGTYTDSNNKKKSAGISTLGIERDVPNTVIYEFENLINKGILCEITEKDPTYATFFIKKKHKIKMSFLLELENHLEDREKRQLNSFYKSLIEKDVYPLPQDNKDRQLQSIPFSEDVITEGKIVQNLLQERNNAQNQLNKKILPDYIKANLNSSFKLQNEAFKTVLSKKNYLNQTSENNTSSLIVPLGINHHSVTKELLKNKDSKDVYPILFKDIILNNYINLPCYLNKSINEILEDTLWNHQHKDKLEFTQQEKEETKSHSKSLVTFKNKISIHDLD